MLNVVVGQLPPRGDDKGNLLGRRKEVAKRSQLPRAFQLVKCVEAENEGRLKAREYSYEADGANEKRYLKLVMLS